MYVEYICTQVCLVAPEEDRREGEKGRREGGKEEGV